MMNRDTFIMITLWVVLFSGLMAFSAPASAEDDPEGEFMDMSLEQLMDIEVTVASKKAESINEAPGIVNTVSAEEIDQFGDRNLHQLLQREPSVYTRGSYLYPHNLASFRGDMATHLDLHTLLLINGRPIRSSSFGGDNFPMYLTFPLSHVSRIEVIRGPGSALYGTNAFTGVVNLKSRVIPEKNTMSFSGVGGTEGYWSSTASAGGKSGMFGYVSDFRASGQKGYKIAMYDDNGTFNTDYDTNKSFSTMNHFQLDKYLGGTVTLDLFFSNLETFYMGVIPRWGFSDSNWRTNILFGNLGYALKLNDNYRVEFNLTCNRRRSNFDRPVKYETDLNSEDWIGEVTLFANPIEKMNIVLGASQENQRKIGDDNSNDTIDPPYNVEPKNAYGQIDYRFNQMIKAIGGLQWNTSAYGTSDTVTRLGVILTPWKKWGIKLLRGEAFRAPFALETTLYDATVLVGNKNLIPENLVTYDAQIFYTNNNTHAALTYFDTSIENLIIRDVSVTPPTFKNGGTQDFQGVELEWKHFFNEKAHILGSYTYQDSTQSSDVNPSTVPHHMFKIGSACTWDWGSAGLFYSFFSKPPRLASEVVVNPEPDALNLLSLNVEIDTSKWLDIPKGQSKLTFKAENLFDNDIYVPEFNRGGNPNSLLDGPGITFYAGLQFRR